MPSRSQYQRPAPVAPISSSYLALLASFERTLRADNKSPRTIQTYGEATALLGQFLADHGMPSEVRGIERAHVEAFMIEELAHFSPASALNRYTGLRAWFRWLLEEGEIAENPMARMHPPAQPETPVPFPDEDAIRAILTTCSTGKDFRSRRDLAIIRLLLDTGMRRQEIARLHVSDINLDTNVAVVRHAKFNRVRNCPFGRKAALALDRYLRMRAGHALVELPDLWLGRNGPMTESGVYQVVRDRAAEAGYAGVYTHLWRHNFAHMWLASGGQESDLMRLAGWKSRQMLQRYGASAADERAREAYQQRSPGDRF